MDQWVGFLRWRECNFVVSVRTWVFKWSGQIFLFYLEYKRPKTKSGPGTIVEKWVWGGWQSNIEGAQIFFLHTLMEFFFFFCLGHPGTVIRRHLWKRFVIHLDIIVVDHIRHVPPPQQIYNQLYTRLTFQINDRPITSKVGHLMEIMRSHCHLPISNVKGVGSLPPPFSQGLHQDGASMALQQ